MAWIEPETRPLTMTEMKNNAQLVANFFIKKGWTKYSIAGMLGNIQEESSINPGRWQSDWIATPNTNTGFGLVQWTPPSKMVNWAGSRNWKTGDVQCDRIEYEKENNIQWFANPSRPDLPYISFKEFTRLKDEKQSAQYFLAFYEHPANPNQPNRSTNASYWLSVLDWTGAGDGEDGDGYQLAVLPIHYIHVTQSEFTKDYSHAGTEAVDMVGKTSRFPLYTPCDVICKGVDRVEAFVIWQSQKEVRCVDGTTSYITFNIGHDDTHYQYNIGDTFKKGELFGHTGNSGHSSGDHLHIEVSKGKYVGNWAGGGLPNPTKLWYVFSSCDNVSKETFEIVQAGGIPWSCDLNWKDGSGGTKPDKKSNNLIKFLLLNTLNGWNPN